MANCSRTRKCSERIFGSTQIVLDFHFLLEVGIEARLEGRICPLCNFRTEGPFIAASRRSVYFNTKYEPLSPMLMAIAG
jgi:hypothetical protein